MPSDAIQCKPLEVVVSDRGIERAIKMLKRKLASEGVLRELKMRRHYMKPSVKRRKKQAEAARRRRKRAKMDAAPPKATAGTAPPARPRLRIIRDAPRPAIERRHAPRRTDPAQPGPGLLPVPGWPSPPPAGQSSLRRA